MLSWNWWWVGIDVELELMLSWNRCCNWSKAPRGAILKVESFTDKSIPPFLRWRLRDRSKIDLNALDLWGIATIGEIFSWGGRLSLISSHRISFACPTLTLLAHSTAKCASALVYCDDWWGPRATASHISSFDHGLPVFCKSHQLNWTARGWVCTVR